MKVASESQFTYCCKMKSSIGVEAADGEEPPGAAVQSAIFLCDQEGLEVCLRKQLIGTAESCGRLVRPGDLLFLYVTEDRQLCGIWSAASEVGAFDSSPWGRRNPLQVRVDRASDTLIRVPGRVLSSVLGDAAIGAQVLSGSKAHDLARLVQFAGIHRRTPPRDLFLVRWTAWAVLAALITLAVFVLWGLATHEPSQFPFDSD